MTPLSTDTARPDAPHAVGPTAATLLRLRGLLEVSRLVRDEADVPTLLDEVARTIADSLGWRVVAVNLYRPAWDDFEVVTVHGSVEARAALVGETQSSESWRSRLDPRFERRGAFLVPAGGPGRNGDGPDAWHREDELFVPLADSDGTVLGIISISAPVSNARPSDEELDVLVAVARHAAAAVENAQAARRGAQRRAALERLVEVSSHLNAGVSVDAMLQLVCEQVRHSLGFDKVSIQLLDADGWFRAHGAAGFRPDDPAAQLGLTEEDLKGVFVPAFEIEGCYLIPLEETLARVPETITLPYASVNNGRGPHAWNRHWLAVPLVDRQRKLAGFVWADDPVDRLLPGRERLQVLRMFANQVTTALEFRGQFEELQRSRELYRKVLDNSTDVISLLDLEGTVLFTSGASEKLVGRRPEEIVGVQFGELVHPDDLEECASSIARALAGETVEPFTARVRHQDGNWRTVEGVPACIVGEDGQPEMLLAVARDVTDRHQLEEELRQSQRIEAVGRLAGGIAHDFNNLLTAIVGYGELALAKLGEREPKARADVEEMNRAAERAAALTHQLLAFSRRQVLQPTVLDLNAVVAEMEAMLGRLLGEHVQLRTSLARDIGRTKADKSQIEQVVVNLAINARDAMPGGGHLVIETYNAELDEEWAARHVGGRGGSYVAIAVTDTGMGMDAATRGRIFEPFFTTKAPGEGTGLGLATVYGIVKQSGGYLSVYSEEGRGTAFKIYLPRVDDEPASGSRHEREQPVGGTETVMLVEDEQIVRTLVHEMLEAAGYHVVSAETPARALELFDEHAEPIDLLLTDVVMPGMSGRELADRLVSLRPGLRVLFTSGYTRDAISHQGVLDEGTAFLEKPFTASGLARAVRETLERDA